MSHATAAVDGAPSLARHMLKATSYYTLAAVAQRSMSIVMLPLYTRCLDRAAYGVIELLDLIWTLAALLVSVQLSTALFYYYHRAESESEGRRDVITAYFGTVLLGTLAGVAGVLTAPAIGRLVFHSAGYERLIRVVLVGLGFNLPAEFGFAYLRLHNRARAYMAITVGRVLANVGLNVAFLTILGLGVATMPLSSLITTCSLAILFAPVILAENRPSLFHLPTLWKMVLYGMPLGVGVAGEVVLHFGDRLFLSRWVTLDDLGLYGLAYKLGMVVPFAALPFFNYWNSQMVAILRRPDGERAYARVATYLLLGLTLVVLLLTAFINPVMDVLVESSFRRAAAFVPPIALAYLVRGMGSYWSNAFLLVNRPALVAQVTWLGAGGCLIAYAVLIPRYGLWGAVIATHLGFALMASFALWKGQRLRPFDYEYGRWCKILACGAAAALPALLLRPPGLGARGALGLACVGLFPVLLWLTCVPTQAEVRQIRKGLAKLIGSRGSLS